ncbi:MAPEG family protein [Leptospira ilyithenensis]|uniref:MAPEG family protein n=1 Tax=Leptospira ilyithenensis TaxID=2484901 RepID=A0A4R9LQ94_9LEPT|nr:MAPEG family protein [Leptospira ilyithenensis]TGN08150.1 MAPEG family protein [Leptospira ilyithenensis]
MTIPYVCILFSLLLIYINKIPVSLAMAKEEGGSDNHYPRDQQARLTGIGKRALGAHQNSIEAFPVFYLTDLTRFRSVVWTIGLVLSVSLYLLPFYS